MQLMRSEAVCHLGEATCDTGSILILEKPPWGTNTEGMSSAYLTYGLKRNCPPGAGISKATEMASNVLGKQDWRPGGEGHSGDSLICLIHRQSTPPSHSQLKPTSYRTRSWKVCRTALRHQHCKLMDGRPRRGEVLTHKPFREKEKQCPSSQACLTENFRKMREGSMLNIRSSIRTLVGTCTLKRNPQKPGPSTEMGTLIQRILNPS